MSADRKPIQPSEIRKGDLIRSESPDERAWEYRADYDGGDGRAVTSLSMKHYLLDRPTPPVELPTRPTLGFVSGDWDGPDRLAVWSIERDATWAWLRPVDNEGDTDRTVGKSVTAFVPATAVPTEALGGLRHVADTQRAGYLNVRIIDDFLAAVDEANGAAS